MFFFWAKLLSFIFEQNKAVGIIGGAEGPTALFIAEKSSSNGIFSYIIAIVICLGIIIFFTRKSSS